MMRSHESWIDIFEERAGILEFDAALPRAQAERHAFADMLGLLIDANGLDQDWLDIAGEWHLAELPVAWIVGALILQASPPKGDWPDRHWLGLQDAVSDFCSTWAAQALKLGWSERELFGCQKDASWRRLDGMGLVLRCYRDAELVSLDEGGAVFRVSQSTQRYRRGQNAPLYPAEQSLIWLL